MTVLGGWRPIFAGLLLLVPWNLQAWEPASQPVEIDQEQVDAWIEQMGDSDYFARERAQQKLAELGFAAFDALMAAEHHHDIEVAARARYLVRLLQVELSRETDSPQVQRRLADYGSLNDANRLLRMQQLAALPEDEGLEALCRLTRFETSHVMSRQAAIQIIEQKSKDEAWPQRGETILAALGNSPRPAANWLRAYVASHAAPDEAVVTWSELIDEEQAVREQSPDQSSDEILVALLRYQVELLERLERTDEALAAMRNVIELENPDTVNLPRLLEWLSEHRAWDMLDDVETRFAERFRQEPLTLYSLAEARRLQGRDDAACDLAEQARALKPNDHNQHLVVAQTLRERGLVQWSEAELRHVIELGPAENPNVLMASFRLADQFYDQERYLEAATLLETELKQLEERAGAANNTEAIRNLAQIRGPLTSRLHYYYSVHYHEQANYEQEAEHLQAAIQQDPEDVDVLIALHRLPNAGAVQREETDRLIEQAAEKLRADVRAAPDEAVFYNQLAWLLANTDRHLEEALRNSKRSLELKPGEAGYLDTLARCYYHMGDLENAVRYQAQAVELEPHVGQIARQLQLFESDLEKSRAADTPQP